jgi:hypothetical protein
LRVRSRAFESEMREATLTEAPPSRLRREIAAEATPAIL